MRRGLLAEALLESTFFITALNNSFWREHQRLFALGTIFARGFFPHGEVAFWVAVTAVKSFTAFFTAPLYNIASAAFRAFNSHFNIYAFDIFAFWITGTAQELAKPAMAQNHCLAAFFAFFIIGFYSFFLFGLFRI